MSFPQLHASTRRLANSLIHHASRARKRIFLSGFLFATTLSQAATYTWDTSVLYTRQHTTPSSYNFITDWVPGPDGTGQSLKITEPSSNEYNYFLDVPRSYLTTGTNQFRAVIKFRVVTPTVLPDYFFMLARTLDSGGHVLAGAPEYWQRFVNDSSVGQRTVEFPIDFKPVTGGTWHFYFGCKRTGAIIIDSLEIKEGWNLTLDEPLLGGMASSVLPTGVTAATGAPAITITPPASGTVTTITANNLTADAGTPATSAIASQNSTRLQAWFDQARTTVGTKKLLIPPGTYRFESNAQLNIQNTSDLTIDGQGCTFIFQKLYQGPHFMISNCTRMVIKNLNIDWNSDYMPIASLGKVLSLSADKKTAVFEFANQDAAQTLRTKQSYWYSLFPMDPVYLYCNKPGFFLLNDSPQPSLTASGNQITAVFSTPLSLEVNTSYCIKHLYYQMIAFKLASCSNILFDTINVYGVPGMGWLNTEDSHHLKWNLCKFVRRSGSYQPLVTGADGIHSQQSQGYLSIGTCYFTGLGDDAINIHDDTWQGSLVYSSTANQLIFKNAPRHQLRLKAGDTVRFFKPDYSPTGVDLVVTGTPTFTSPNGDPENATATMTVNFTTAVPAGLSSLSIANNMRFDTQNVRIGGNQILYTNGRGVLFSGKNATLDSNYFRNVAGDSLQITTEIQGTAYMEGRGASNVVVSNNTFENTNQIGRYNGAVVAVEADMPWGPNAYPLFSTLLFDGNRFYNTPGPAISITSAQNVIVRNSRIENNQTMPGVTPFTATLQAVLSEDMALGGNTWRGFVSPPTPTGVSYNTDLTSNIEVRYNLMQYP